jgi:hypothetical protein
MPIYEYRCGHWQSRDTHRRIFSVALGKTARSVREVIEAARERDLPKGLDE